MAKKKVPITSIELRSLGVKITALTPQKVVDKYSKDYPEIKNIKTHGGTKD